MIKCNMRYRFCIYICMYVRVCVCYGWDSVVFEASTRTDLNHKMRFNWCLLVLKLSGGSSIKNR